MRAKPEKKTALSLILLLFLSGCTNFAPDRPTTETPNAQRPTAPTEICFERAQKCFFVEIADTPEERRIGLMERDRLDDNQGMWFAFDEPQINRFWMKNTRIPLDMIWIDENHRIVGTTTLAAPCTNDPCPVYGVDTPTKFVLEIRGGASTFYGIVPGDRAIVK